MNITIRKAERNDIPAIYDLVKALAIYEKEPNAVTATLDTYYEVYDDDLIDSHVAEIDHQIIGMSLYYMTFSTWKGKMLYLEDLYVQESYRTQGIGQRLLDAFLAEAKYKNCSMVKWQVLDWNTPAIEFYKKNEVTIETEWLNCKKIF